MHRLISEWAAFEAKALPYILPGDEVLLEPTIAAKWTTVHSGWKGFVADPHFGDPKDRRFHLGLLPLPFAGNLSSASIFILMLNPGLGPDDYFGEYHVEDYRKALQLNLTENDLQSKNIFLDPTFAWHGGFEYWHGKLRRVVTEFASIRNITRLEALSILSQKIAMLEFIPYHSVSSGLPVRIVNQLRSVKLVKQFAHEVLVPRADAGEILIVVTRAEKHWDLIANENVIIYSGQEARSAYLTPHSRGGAAILSKLNTGSN